MHQLRLLLLFFLFPAWAYTQWQPGVGDSARAQPVSQGTSLSSNPSLASQIKAQQQTLTGDESTTIYLYLNDDTIPDYFTVTSDGEPFYGSHGFFMDGATGQSIPTDSLLCCQGGLAWARDLPLAEAVDVDCGDGQQELLIRSCHLHQGTTYEMEMYRYSKSRNRIVQVFDEIIVSGGYEVHDSSYVERYSSSYVDVLYHHGDCMPEIRSRAGVWKEELSPFEPGGIVPVKNSRIYTYTWDAKAETFVLKK